MSKKRRGRRANYRPPAKAPVAAPKVPPAPDGVVAGIELLAAGSADVRHRLGGPWRAVGAMWAAMERRRWPALLCLALLGAAIAVPAESIHPQIAARMALGAAVGVMCLLSVWGRQVLRGPFGTSTATVAMSLCWALLFVALAALPGNCPGTVPGTGRCRPDALLSWAQAGLVMALLLWLTVALPLLVARGARKGTGRFWSIATRRQSRRD